MKVELFVKMNVEKKVPKQFLKNFDLEQNLPAEVTAIFKSLTISPHFAQELYMKIICNSKEHTNKFFTIAPGLGKTKLILCNAIDLARK